jgi:hypothetical protein
MAHLLADPKPTTAEGATSQNDARRRFGYRFHTGDMENPARLGMMDDPDGLPLRIFSPDDHGTPHLIAVDGATARTPDERRLLVTAANIVLATLWQWSKKAVALR